MDKKDDLMSPQHRGGIPLWQQIDQALALEIADGHWLPGARLPSEQSLALRFTVNRHTIRRAIAALVTRGLLRVEQGRGSFVADGVIDYRIARRTRLGENLQQNHRRATSRFLYSCTVLPPTGIALLLAQPETEPVLRIERLSYSGESPLAVVSIYVSAQRFPGFDQVFAQELSVTQSLARFGIADYTRASTRLSARLPSLEEARLLRQPPGRPILHSEALDVDLGGQPILVSIARFAGDRVQIIFDTGSLQPVPL